MKVFVAGATGALGVPLVRALVAHGHEVVGMTRTPGKRALLEQMGARAMVADALDAKALAQAVREAAPTHVVHLLTALPKNGPLRPKDVAATNVLRIQGTANLLQAAIAAGVQRIVAESYAYVYGYGDHGPRPLSEDDPPPPRDPERAFQPADDALRALEAQVLDVNRQGKIEAVVLRYGMLYGPENPGIQALLGMLRGRRLPIVRGAKGLATFVHEDDAVTAMLAALERGRPGAIYHIVDDEAVGFNTFVVAAAQAIGAPQPYALPGWLLRLLAPLVVPVATSRLVLSNARAKAELGWQPRFANYRVGLADLVRRLPAQESNAGAAARTRA
ncbi:MAG TPA: NAD(P)-dependent oxidoreductase [Herpetosiphonaceae bacterium]|nr:NAD(P)-dependent oxidoreductase [Herpetosiphonaceae bacterium]